MSVMPWNYFAVCKFAKPRYKRYSLRFDTTGTFLWNLFHRLKSNFWVQMNAMHVGHSNGYFWATDTRWILICMCIWFCNGYMDLEVPSAPNLLVALNMWMYLSISPNTRRILIYTCIWFCNRNTVDLDREDKDLKRCLRRQIYSYP